MFVESNEYPIDRISRVFLQKDSDEYAGGWKVDSLTVTINGIPNFDGPVDTWLEEDHLYWSAPVMSVPPQRIPVVIDITADVVGDTVSLHTYFVSSVHVPYSGPATLAVQHGDGTVTTYQLNIGSDGSLVRSLPLSPNDKLQAHIYRPKENNTQEIYTGGTPWIHPSIPYEQITINADAFNDTVSGTIGGSYHGPVEILVRDMEGAADDRVYRTSARSGQYSLSIPIVGSDGVGVWSFCEGVRLPRGEYLVAPDLNSLEFSTGISGHDGLDGTVVNSANDPVGSFIGDVYLDSRVPRRRWRSPEPTNRVDPKDRRWARLSRVFPLQQIRIQVNSPSVRYPSCWNSAIRCGSSMKGLRSIFPMTLWRRWNRKHEHLYVKQSFHLYPTWWTRWSIRCCTRYQINREWFPRPNRLQPCT